MSVPRPCEAGTMKEFGLLPMSDDENVPEPVRRDNDGIWFCSRGLARIEQQEGFAGPVS